MGEEHVLQCACDCQEGNSWALVLPFQNVDRAGRGDGFKVTDCTALPANCTCFYLHPMTSNPWPHVITVTLLSKYLRLQVCTTMPAINVW